MSTDFVTNMRQNRETRLNPLSYGGHSYDKAANTTAVSALKDIGLYAIEPSPMGALVGGEWRPSSFRELYRTPTDSDPEYRSFGVVGKDYIPVQPETIAYLWDRYVKDEAKNPIPITAIRMDRFGERLIFSHEIKRFEVKARGDRKVGDEISSHVVFNVPFTPGAAISLSTLIERLACLNGAVRKDSNTTFRVIHMGNPEETLTEMLMGIYAYGLEQAALDEAVFNELAQKLLNPIEINWILSTAYPLPPRPVNEAHRKYVVMVENWEKLQARINGCKSDILTLYNGAGIGADMETMKGTPYGLIQAVSQFEGDRRTSSFASATVDMLAGGDRAATISRAITAALKVTRGQVDPAAELEAVIVR